MDALDLPYGQQIEVRHVFHESGVPLLRLIIRDGGRYMTLDLDPGTASRLRKVIQAWIDTEVLSREADRKSP
ncbi:MAG: DUF6967 family protein [Thioalkalivibrionaceae bacterium]